MKKNPFHKLENNNLDQQLEAEENLLDKNSEEILQLLLEKENPTKEKAELLKKHLGVFWGPFMLLSEEALLQQQALQQKQVETYFHKDPSIEITSLYNNADGSGSLDIKNEIKKAGEDSNKIIILLNGIVNPQDIVQGMNPNVAKLCMIFLRLNLVNLVTYGLDIKKLIKGDSIPNYIINTIQSIKGDLFQGKPTKVTIIRNANSKDLSHTIEAGGGNTVLVVGGHGTFNSLRMTDKSISSEDVPIPEKKLKAFVQHTCAMNTEQEEMGSRFAKKTFGWTRGTNPLDFIENPLPPRTNFENI
jgi:hypothetical protein